MKTVRSMFRPPITDEEYIESVRMSIARERIDGVYCFATSVGFFLLFFVAWLLFEWLTMEDECPEVYYRRAAGLLFGVAGGALAGFGLSSLCESGARRTALQGSLALVVLLIAALLVFWMPVVIQRGIEGHAEKSGFRLGVWAGAHLGFILYYGLQSAVWARQKLTGERRAEQLVVKYYDQLT